LYNAWPFGQEKWLLGSGLETGHTPRLARITMTGRQHPPTKTQDGNGRWGQSWAQCYFRFALSQSSTRRRMCFGPAGPTLVVDQLRHVGLYAHADEVARSAPRSPQTPGNNG
jgi:hypothetical protein